jgi:hypothetical protein
MGPGPLRRWRTLIIVVAVWLLGWYYFFHGDSASSLLQGTTQTPVQIPHAEDATVHWSKLPERYPVPSLKSLPTGQPATGIPNIQQHPPPEENREARKTRKARLTAVRNSFKHSWTGYKQHAWLYDEVGPLSGNQVNPFGGWAATLVDALDTLWIMGLTDEFKRAVKAVEVIDFTTTAMDTINVFETTIRYLGGFLAAYELSDKRFPALLRKAVEVGELLMCAFDTPNRMPITRWDWKA